MKEHIPLILDTIGTLLIAWAALRVHHRVLMEHKIDRNVRWAMRSEQFLGVAGAALVIISLILQLTVFS